MRSLLNVKIWLISTVLLWVGGTHCLAEQNLDAKDAEKFDFQNLDDRAWMMHELEVNDEKVTNHKYLN